MKDKENLLFSLLHDVLVLYLPIQKGASPHTTAQTERQVLM